MCVIRTAPATISSPPYVRSCERELTPARAIMAALHRNRRVGGGRRPRACSFDLKRPLVAQTAVGGLASNKEHFDARAPL